MNLGQWIGLLAFILSLYILWQIKQILLLAFAAVVLATALNRLARYLQRRLTIKRSGAVFLAISSLILVFVIFGLLIVPPFGQEFQQLTQRVPEGINKGIERLNDWFEQLQYQFSGELGQLVLEKVKVEDLLQQLRNLVNQLAEGSGSFIGSTVGFVGNTVAVFFGFLLVVILSIMIVAEPLAYRRAFVRLFPSFYRRRVEEILDRCDEALGGWMIGMLVSMTVIAICSWVGLSLLGVRLAVANGVLAGLFNFIPNIGPTLSVIPPIAISLIDAPWKCGAVLLLYIGLQQLESHFLTPFVMAQQLSLLPALTLLSQLFFATFFGFLGLVLALPLTVVAQVWLQEVLVKDVLDRWQGDVEPRHAVTLRGWGEGLDIPSPPSPPQGGGVGRLGGEETGRSIPSTPDTPDTPDTSDTPDTPPRATPDDHKLENT